MRYTNERSVTVTERSIDLNADLGEECGDDTAMLDLVTSANISCGVHAGNPLVLHRILRAARERNVRVGAHPSYPDRVNFGRASMSLTFDEMNAVLTYQIKAFVAINAQTLPTFKSSLPYIKAHGALYNDAYENEDIASALVHAAMFSGDRTAIMHLPGGAVQDSANHCGIEFIAEAFADRAYTAQGTLVPRGQPGAVLHDPVLIADRVVRLVTTGTVEAVDGTTITLEADSVCLHGDTPGAVLMAVQVRAALNAADVSIRSTR